MNAKPAGTGGALLPRPNKLILLSLKAPKFLYHLNLGWMFGHRILLLTHCGRKSGLIHQTPLEVVRYDKATRTSIVISAWGEKSDWYRNIVKTPALQIQTGRDRFVPDQRVLTAEETERELEIYVAHHGLSATMLSRVFGLDFAHSVEARHAVRQVCPHDRVQPANVSAGLIQARQAVRDRPGTIM